VRGRVFNYQNMTEALRVEVVVRLPRCQSVEIGALTLIDAQLLLFANKLLRHIPEIPLRRLSELIVSAHLFADDAFSAVVD
jgi:hypothetical protein